MRTWALPLFFLLGVTSLTAQENCANGIDDDADGLIDLNDVGDCSCALSSTISSLLPNPSLEEFADGADGCYSLQPGGYPDAVNQANCLTGWERASLGTTDAWNAFTLPAAGPYFPATLPQPLPSGSGVAGFWVGIKDKEMEHQFTNGDGTTTDGYREYLAACLVDGQRMESGLPYRLQFSLGFIEPQQAVEEKVIDIRSPGNVELSVYGIRECSQVNFGNFFGCPEEADAAGYELIANITVDGEAGTWTPVELDFTAPGTYEAFAIGGSCKADITRPDGGFYRNYYFIDELILNHPAAFAEPVTGPIQVSGLTVCEPITLSASPQDNATYQWYRNGIAMVGQTQRTVTLTPDFSLDGDYRVRVSTPAGCGVSEAVHIQRPVITDQFPDTVAICRIGDTISVSPRRAGAATFLWEDGSTDSKLMVSQPGIYSVTVTEACQEHTEQFVAALDAPFHYKVSMTPENPCPGDTVTITVTTNSYRPRIFFRSLPEETMLPARGGTVKVVAGETPSILAFVGNKCGLTMDTLLIPVALPFPGTVSSVTDINCATGSGEISIDPRTDSAVNYQWFDGSGKQVGTNAPRLNVSLAGTYSVSLTDGIHCQERLYFTVNELSSVHAFTTVIDGNCRQAGSIRIDSLTGSLPFAIRWFRNGKTMDAEAGNYLLSDAQPGNYRLEVRDASGCRFERSFLIEEPSVMSATINTAYTDCYQANTGEVTTIASGGTAPYTYRLADGKNQSSATFSGLTEGEYAITVTDAAGCSITTETIAINYPEPAILNLESSILIRPGESAAINPKSLRGESPEDTYSWAPTNGLSCTDCIAPAAAPRRTTEYTLTYTTSAGCTTSERVLVVVSDDAGVYVPNAFSPNNDGVNDTFQAFTGSGVVAVTEMNVFGRWGELVWQQESSEGGSWDGTFRNREMEAGVYVYSGTVLLANGESRPITGSVTLVR